MGTESDTVPRPRSDLHSVLPPLSSCWDMEPCHLSGPQFPHPPHEHLVIMMRVNLLASQGGTDTTGLQKPYVWHEEPPAHLVSKCLPRPPRKRVSVPASSSCGPPVSTHWSRTAGPPLWKCSPWGEKPINSPAPVAYPETTGEHRLISRTGLPGKEGWRLLVFPFVQKREERQPLPFPTTQAAPQPHPEAGGRGEKEGRPEQRDPDTSWPHWSGQ